MSSGYEKIDPRMIQRASEAPMFNPAQGFMPPQPGRFLQGIADPNVNTPLPGGIEDRIRQLQQRRGAAPTPGQPKQVAPDNPPPPPPPKLRSVLIRGDMG